MFERFTQQARDAVRVATEAAFERGHEKVQTSHLLFGLVSQGGEVGRALASLGLDEAALRDELTWARVVSLGGRDVDTEALATIGIDYDAIRAAVERRFGEGALNVTLTRQPPRRSWLRRRTRSVRFSAEARRALERSLRIALARGEKELTPRHLVLAVLSDPFCVALRVMQRRGVTAAQVRTALGEA